MPVDKMDRRYGKPVQIGLAGEGAFGTMISNGINNGRITAKEGRALLRYRKMLSNKKRK